MNFYQLYNLLNEYGQNLIQTLIEKFTKEDPDLSPTIIRNYIERFERIKNNLENKDISTYSWQELENIVDGYQGNSRIKAGKLDPTVTDANLLYNNDGIRIYLGKDKKSCIRYSNGYSFCIGARGASNQYGYYRIAKNGTPYFIFNDNLSKQDNRHLMVLFVFENSKKTRWYDEGIPRNYSITLADNKGDKGYHKLSEIIQQYPWVEKVKHFVEDNIDSDDVDKWHTVTKGHVPVKPLEALEHYLEVIYSEKKRNEIDLLYWPSDFPTEWNYKQNQLVNSLGLDTKNVAEFLEEKNIPVEISIHLICYRMAGDKILSRQDDYQINNNGDGFFFKNTKVFVQPLEKINSNLNLRFYHLNDEQISFVKNSNEVIKKIKQEIKRFVSLLYRDNGIDMTDKLDEINKSIEEKKQEVEKILHQNNDSFSDDMDVLRQHSVTGSFKSLKNVITVPYFVISIGTPKTYVEKFLEANKKASNNILSLDKKYSRRMNWVKSQPESVLKEIVRKLKEIGWLKIDKVIDEHIDK